MKTETNPRGAGAHKKPISEKRVRHYVYPKLVDVELIGKDEAKQVAEKAIEEEAEMQRKLLNK